MCMLLVSTRLIGPALMVKHALRLHNKQSTKMVGGKKSPLKENCHGSKKFCFVQPSLHIFPGRK